MKFAGLDIAEMTRLPLKERARIGVLLELGLGYLSMERSTPTLSPGELQRLRLATQVHSNLFGVVYLLDEPCAGLHPADVEKLMAQLDGLVEAGNTVIVVEHDTRVVAGSDWVMDVGPGAGEEGGRIVAAGTPAQVARTPRILEPAFGAGGR